MANVWTNDEIEMVAERAYELSLQGKHSEALAIFEGLLTIDPRNIYCLDSLAALSLTLGSAQRAIDYATLALTLSPRFADGLARRCEAYLLLGEIASARQDFESLRQLGATAHVKRLSLRMANAGKNSNNLLQPATMRQLER